MIERIDRIQNAVYEILRHEGGSAFAGREAINKEQAARIAESLKCACAFRYRGDKFEFSSDSLAFEGYRDEILYKGQWLKDESHPNR